MQGDFLTKIRATCRQMTKAEKKVADYILQNPRSVLFLSITELAELCEVGETSVFRFCKTLGVKGYQEFKMMLSLSLHEGEEQLDQFTGSNVTLEDSFSDLVRKVLRTNVKAIEETCSLLQEENVERTVQMLYEARRVYFFGVGASMLTAMKAMNKFMRIENKMFCIQDSHMQVMAAASMCPQDVAVLFSYSGQTKDTIYVANVAKKAGAGCICITRFAKSPLSACSDITLLCGANEGPLQGGSTSAEISQLFLVDIIYTEYYRRFFSHCSENNRKVSIAVSEKLC